MSALTPAMAGTVKSLAQWVRVASVAASVNGVLLMVAALLTVLFGTMSNPELQAMFVARGTFEAAMALVGIFTGFMLRRYAEKLALAAQIRHTTPIVDGSAYEMGYWRLTAPTIAFMLLIALASIVLFLVIDIPAITTVPERVSADLAVYGDTANLVGIFLGILGLVLIATALRPATTR